MIAENNHNSPSLAALVGRVARVALGGLRTRAELLAIELQEERLRLTQLVLWSMVLVFLGILGALLLTATIIFLFPEDARIYVMAAFAVLYLLGAAAVSVVVKSLLKREPFSESIDQVKKDRLWLESLK